MSDAAATTEAEFWHVQLPNGEVRYWSLEELDDAFQKDLVDAKTYVLKEGDTTWQKLGELLGLDEDAQHVSIPVAPYSVSMSTPQAMRLSDAPAALSIRPVVSDVDLEDDDDLVAAMKPKRKNVAFVGGGVAAALLIAIVGITHASAGSEEKAAAAAPPPPPVVAAVAPPAVDPTPTLSDDMKRALLDADKARAAKTAAKAAENAKYKTTAGSYRQPKSGQVFHKGGNKYDPLNSGN
jgi:hypothetical protein